MGGSAPFAENSFNRQTCVAWPLRWRHHRFAACRQIYSNCHHCGAARVSDLDALAAEIGRARDRGHARAGNDEHGNVPDGAEADDVRKPLGVDRARVHADVDGAFWQWNDVWLSEAFRSFDIRSECQQISSPVLAMQGVDDIYGSLRHIEELHTQGTVRREVLQACGHSPHKDQPMLSLQLVTDFLKDLP